MQKTASSFGRTTIDPPLKLRILALLKNAFAEFADEFGFTLNPFSSASTKLSNQVDATEGLPDYCDIIL